MKLHEYDVVWTLDRQELDQILAYLAGIFIRTNKWSVFFFKEEDKHMKGLNKHVQR